MFCDETAIRHLEISKGRTSFTASPSNHKILSILPDAQAFTGDISLSLPGVVEVTERISVFPHGRRTAMGASDWLFGFNNNNGIKLYYI
jgi:hypothetical protein